MKKINLKSTPLAKKIALVLATSAALGAMAPANALPVFDAANLVANSISAGANVATAIKMHKVIYELKKANGYHSRIADNTDVMTGNTTNIMNDTTNIKNISVENNYYNPEVPVIPDPCETIPPGPGCIPVFGVLNTGTFENGVNDYLANFKTAEQYANNSQAFENTNNKQNRLSEMQNKANAARINTLVSQRNSLEQDNALLTRLKAESALGINSDARMQREYANRIAAVQTRQETGVRAMLMAQQNADAIRAQAVADQEAASAGQNQNLRKVVFTANSKPATW